MALPASGQISIGGIRTELSNTGTNNFSLVRAGANGVSRGEGYTPLNQSSTSKPNFTAPYGMNEWYSYNHSANTACGSSWVATPSIGAMYTYYRFNITGTAGNVSTISFYGVSIPNPYIFANIYNTYPFTSTGNLIGTAPLKQLTMFNGGTNSYLYTLTSSSDVIHIVIWDDSIL